MDTAVDLTSLVVSLLFCAACGALVWSIWYSRSPAAMERRKAARRRLWLQHTLSLNASLENGSVPTGGRRSRLRKPFWELPFGARSDEGDRPMVDREAFEREVRRWD